MSVDTSARKLVKDFLSSTSAPEDVQDIERKKERIHALLEEKDAVLVAHYYTDPVLQALAEETGGCVSDSLQMARFGQSHPASTLLVAGVKFMGETAKILSPDKRVFMPTLEATCSLDVGCPIEAFGPFCDEHADREVVVYANTSAAVKARADWVVTSSIALEVVEHLHDQGKSILWAPDKHLGAYIQRETGVDMLLWDGACIVHEEFKAQGVQHLKDTYPEAAVLAHPESPQEVLTLADFIGSTSGIIEAAKTLPNTQFIVATDQGIFYKLQQEAPDKQFVIAPTAGDGGACQSCARCPWMAMNSLDGVLHILEHMPTESEIHVPADLAKRAMVPLERMVNFAVDKHVSVVGKA